MALPDAWLTAVLDAGGDIEPPPDPKIPADYLQKPRRQRPASEQTQLLSSHPPAFFSRPKRRCAALVEIDHPNDLCLRKRQRAPNAPTSVMSQAPRSPSKMSSRIATRKAKNKAPVVEDIIDPNATSRPVRARHKPAPAPAANVPALYKTAMPVLTPSTFEGKLGIDSEDINRSASSVTETSDSRARLCSSTKRMVDLRVAEKTVTSKMVKLPVDLPEDVQGLYEAVQILARVPRGVVPLGIEVRVHPHPSPFPSLTFSLG
jgi:hypothetical protein